MAETSAEKHRKRDASAELMDLDLRAGENFLNEGLGILEVDSEALPKLPRNDPRKAPLANLLMERTRVRRKGMVEELAMGTAPDVSRLAKEVRERIVKGDKATAKLKDDIAKIIT